MPQQPAENLRIMESPRSWVSVQHQGGDGARGVFVSFTLHTLAASASWIGMQPGLGREKLYGMYETKLNSCDDNLGKFLISTVPYLALSLPLSVIWRTLRLASKTSSR